jgi:hypothetical protein
MTLSRPCLSFPRPADIFIIQFVKSSSSKNAASACEIADSNNLLLPQVASIMVAENSKAV